MEAFYFGPDNRQIFAAYHPAIGGSGNVLTLICPPLFNEYMRTHLALRNLADHLAECGQHVLRIDYRGTGDSFDDLDDISLADWLEDIVLSVDEGRDVSGGTHVRVLGVRAGALLACQSVGARDDVRRLVLWDPVHSGEAYLRALRRMQSCLLEGHVGLPAGERREALRECGGHSVPQQTLDDLYALGASVYAGVPQGRLHVVNTSSSAGFPVPDIPVDVVRTECNWETDLENVIVPRSLLEQLGACLTTP